MLPQHPQIMSHSRNTLQQLPAFPQTFKRHFTSTHADASRLLKLRKERCAFQALLSRAHRRETPDYSSTFSGSNSLNSARDVLQGMNLIGL